MFSRPSSPLGNPESSTAAESLSFVQPNILKFLKHLDLSEHVALRQTKVISLGAHGDILKEECILPGRGEVKLAIKRLRFYLKEEIKLLFEKEIYVWAKLSHPNVLPLIGFAFESSSGYPLLISEWMPNGTARKYVKENPTCNLKQFVIGFAEGLAYLHKNDVIHSDLKPDNIVVNASGDACICDFGGSRIIAATNSLAKPTTSLRGTSGYLACELIDYSGVDVFKGHTKESDVWAFGMTVFALLAQQDPYAGLIEAQVTLAIADKHLPPLPPSETWSPERLEAKDVLWGVCQLCWIPNPEERADMPMVLIKLRECSEQVKKEASTHELLSGLGTKLEIIAKEVDDISEILPYLTSASNSCSSLSKDFLEDLAHDKGIIELARVMDEAFDFANDKENLRKTTRIMETLITHLLRKTLDCFSLLGEYAQTHSSELSSSTIAIEKINSFVQSLLEYKNTLARELSLYKDIIAERISREVDTEYLKQILVPRDMHTHDRPVCLENTQVEIRRRIVDWMNTESGPNILWIHGVSGSGKSTIATTISEYFRDISRLGAFIFFEHGTSAPGSIIPTIAFKLALFDSAIGVRVTEQVNANKDIASASATVQFAKLISSTTSGIATSQAPFVVIIDALDECGTPENRGEYLELLKRNFSKLPPYFRLLITSRPEPDIVSAFSSHQELIRSIELDHGSDARKKDVLRYIDLEMRRIFLESELEVPEEWPWDENIELLANAASGLFSWASDAVKRVSNSDDPFGILEELIFEVTAAS